MYVCVCVCLCSVAQSYPTLWGPMDCTCQESCPWNFPDENTGVGCHVLLQGIFPTQGSNPGLLHGWQILYHLATREAPYKVWLCLLWADSYVISISAIQYKPHLFFAQETEIKPLTVQANVYFLLHLSKRQTMCLGTRCFPFIGFLCSNPNSGPGMHISEESWCSK